MDHARSQRQCRKYTPAKKDMKMKDSKTLLPELRAAQPVRAVREGHAVTTELGANASAITYWVSGSNGWHVVTTVDTVIEQNGDAEKHAVVRFSSVFLPGQSQWISVPFAIGERQQVHSRFYVSVARRPSRGCPGSAAPHDGNAELSRFGP